MAVVATNDGSGAFNLVRVDAADALATARASARADFSVGVVLRDDDQAELRAASACAAVGRGQLLIADPLSEVARWSDGFTEAGTLRLATLEPPQVVCTDTCDAPVGITGSLPLRHTPFIGRTSEVLDAAALVAPGRVVTLTGPGGVGKTETALRAAALAAQLRGADVRLVELASLSGADVTAAINEAVTGPDALVVVLDNAEHVLTEVALWVQESLPLTVAVLATSRIPLNVAIEHVVPLPLLTTDDAVALFVDRAARAGATTSDATAVADLCERLDFLPLAIELAAARSRLLSPVAINERLGDRFALLKSRAPTAPAHHASLEAAIGWSYDLLDARQQGAIQRLAVFADRFDLDMAAHVGVDLELLAELVDHSLVTSEPEARVPYRLLDSVRAFAFALGSASDALEHASRGLVTWLLGATELLEGAASIARDELHARLDSAPADVRRAIETAVTHDPSAAVVIVGRLGAWFWDRGRLEEGRELATAVLAADAGDDPLATARLENALANLIVRSGQPGLARPRYERALALRLAHGARTSQIASTRNDLGTCLMHLGDLEGAAASLAEARADYESADDRWGMATVTVNLAAVDVTAGRYDGALDAFRTAADEFTALGDIAHAAAARTNEALVLLETEQDSVAAFAEAIRLILRAGVRFLLQPALEGLASAALRIGDNELAARLTNEGTTVSDDELLSWVTAVGATPAAGAATLRDEGDGWSVSFRGATAVLPVRKGITYLAALLASPGREIRASELAGGHAEQRGTDIVDDAAIAAYRHRVAELEQRLNEADARGDTDAGIAAQAELDHLIVELRRSTDKHGKPRKVGGDDERARKAVGNRIRDAIAVIAKAHPELGRHLAVSVTTGTYCVYAPEQPVDWRISST